MAELNPKCKWNLKYKELAPIDINLFPQIKLIFIFTKFNASDVIFMTTTDDVYGFGSNKYGRLGLGHTNAVTEPTIITELCGKEVTRIEFGEQFMVALTESMDVFTCGHESSGQLGDGQNNDAYLKPQQIDLSGKLIVDVKCCRMSSYLLTETKEIFNFGVRGYGPETEAILSPTLVNIANMKIMSISCGADHTIALADNRKAYAWGDNTYGQLGLGNNGRVSVPQLIPMTDTILIESISCGDNHSLLLATDGKIYSFGYNNCGQLGTGDTINQSLPKPILWDKLCVEIFAFDGISMALSDNNVIIWGSIGKNSILSPLKTNINSFQEAIDVYTITSFSYEPLKLENVFENQSVNRVMNTMRKAFNNKENSDLTLKLKRKGGEDLIGYIYAHKWFVCDNCEYLKQIVSDNCNQTEGNEISDCPTNQIEINGYSYESYYQFIQYIYTDLIETEDMKLLIELFFIANEYLEEKLKAKIILKIKSLMNVDNVSSIYGCALKTKSEKLEQLCFGFMSANITSIIKTEDFRQMDGNDAKIFFTKYHSQK